MALVELLPYVFHVIFLQISIFRERGVTIMALVGLLLYMFHALTSILLSSWVIYINITQPLSKFLGIFVILVPNTEVAKIIILLIQYHSPVTGVFH